MLKRHHSFIKIIVSYSTRLQVAAPSYYERVDIQKNDGPYTNSNFK
jgi:hypothetical protein